MKVCKEIALDRITISPRNPRRCDPNDPAIRELADSIMAVGLLHPVLVRPMKAKGEYELLAGQRRYQAHRLARSEKIVALVSDLDDEQALEVMITENMQRTDLTPLEEARGVAELLKNRDAETVGGVLGKSATWVRRREKLTQLTSNWLTALEGTLMEQGDKMDEALQLRAAMTVGHLEILAHFSTETQDRILVDLQERSYVLQNGSLSSFRSYLANFTMDLSKTPWPIESTQFGGSCQDCPTRSDREPDLFRGVCDTAYDSKGNPTGDIPSCLNPACYREKYTDFIAAKKVEAERKAKQPVVTIGNHYGEHAPKADFKTYECTEAKKGEPGAVPAIRVDGKAAGELVYVIPPKPKDKAKKSGSARQEATLEQTRLYHMMIALNTWLKAQDKCPAALSDARTMLAAVVVYGSYPKLSWSPAATYQKFTKGDESELISQVWRTLKNSLLDELSAYSAESINLSLHEEQFDGVLEVVGLDKQDFLDEAEHEVPDVKPKAE